MLLDSVLAQRAKMWRSIFLVFAILGVLESTKGSLQGGRSCPDIRPIFDFQMNKLVGVWYPIVETSQPLHCFVYNITEGEEPGLLHLSTKDTSRHDDGIPYVGNLTVIHPHAPAIMDLVFPFDKTFARRRTITYTFFAADYKNYVAFSVCIKHLLMPSTNSWRVTLLSRSRHLEQKYIDEVHGKLAKYVDVDFMDIQPEGCKPPESTTRRYYHMHV